jgi:hypothetical protein
MTAAVARYATFESYAAIRDELAANIPLDQ